MLPTSHLLGEPETTTIDLKGDGTQKYSQGHGTPQGHGKRDPMVSGTHAIEPISLGSHSKMGVGLGNGMRPKNSHVLGGP